MSFAYIKNNAGYVEGNSFTDTGGFEWSSRGSVLGPLVFLLFVNELPSWIMSDMKMFADNTKVWCGIKSEVDSITLQEDLDGLHLWSKTWQLK